MPTSRTVRKTPARPATKASVAAQRPATTGAPAPSVPAPPAAAKPDAAAKQTRPQTQPEAKSQAKLLREAYTIPKDEYAALEALKQRALALAQPKKKSELLRAGIAALAAMPDQDFLAALGAVPVIKTGRPGRSSR